MLNVAVHRSYRSVVLLVAMLTGLAVLAFIQDPAAADPPWQPNVLFDGNGTCDDETPPDPTSTTAGTECTLREAIMFTNDNVGPHTINLAAGTYELSLLPNGGDDDMYGDLDVETGNDLTIVGLGQGATIIDANQIDRVFQVHGGAKLTLQNLTVTGGFIAGVSSDYYGAGISNWDTLVLDNVEVTQNYFGYDEGGGGSQYYGAGIYNDVTADISNGSWIHDNGITGGIGNAQYYGGGIYNAAAEVAGANLTISNSSVDSNTLNGFNSILYYYGGGVYNDGVAEMTGGSISNNVVGHGGGGVFNNGTLTLTGTDVLWNRVWYNYGSGGGIYNTGTANLLADTEVEHNEAGTGGGVYNEAGLIEAIPQERANEGMLNVDASSVSANYAWNTSGEEGFDYNGGGIFNYHGTVMLTTAAVNANYAEYYGGGIYNYGGTVTATGSQIGNGNLEECSFFVPLANARTVDDVGGNCAMEGGGIFNVDGGMVTLTNTAVEYNHALTGPFYGGAANGGGIFNGPGLTNGLAASERADASTMVDIIGGTLSFNRADNSGGGAYDLGTMTLDGTTVQGNQAGFELEAPLSQERGPEGRQVGCGGDGQGGGGIYLCEGSVTATNTMVIDNSAALPNLVNGGAGYGNGGGISNYYGELSFTGGSISGNHASSYGGGLYNQGYPIEPPVPVEARDGHIEGHSLLVATVVVGNDVGGDGELPPVGIGGGGVYNYMGQVDIVDTTIDGNMAEAGPIPTSARVNGGPYGNGGGVHNVEPGEVNIDGSTISNNTASNYGGGIYNELYLLNDTVHVVNSTISGNEADEGGGIANEGTMTLDHVTVTDNNAFAGGGVYNGSGFEFAAMDVAASVIAGNTADEVGPDCYNLEASAPVSLGGNVLGDLSDCELVPLAGDLANVNALLGALADNGGLTMTHLPAGTSPAVDLATASTETEDQRDEPRPRNAANDSGAVEVNNPVAVDDAYSVDQAATLVVAAPGVLDNDTGGEGPLTAAVLAPPTNGVLGLAADGSFTYTPTVAFFGMDTFTYTASDTNGGSDTATVKITVNDIGDPVAVDDAYAVDEEATLTVAAPGVLGNDTGVLGVLTAAVLAPPSNGTLALAADGSFVYTPAVGFLGMDTFTYTASDTSGSDTATVKITVNDIGVPGPGILPNFLGNPETVGLYDDDTGLWRLRNSAGVVKEFYFGNPFWQPVAGNWNGDAHDTPGLYNDTLSTWYLRNSNTQGIADRYFLFGDPGDYAIAGDWDGDGVDTPGVVRGDTVHLSNKLGDNGAGLGAADTTYTITGISGGRPFAGDFNGDGKDEVGFTQPNSVAQALNMFIRTTRTSGPPDFTFLFGNPEDLTPSFGDWNDDFVDGPAVYRPAATWGPTARHFYLRNDNSTGIAQYPSIPPFGETDDLPVSGRWGLG